MNRFFACLILLYGCHHADKTATSKLIPDELRGSWIARRDTLKLHVAFLDSSHLKMPDLTNRLFTYKIEPMTDYSLFVIKGLEDSTSVIYYVAHRINENKITMELSKMRYFEPFKKEWIERRPSKEDAKIQYWERVKTK